jgi:hypothetical protein
MVWVPIEVAIRRADGIFPIVSDAAMLLVQQRVARGAVPLKNVHLARSTLALQYQYVRVGPKSGRMRNPCRGVNDGALRNYGDSFFASGIAIVQPQLALHCKCDLITRVDVKLAPVGPTPCDERQGSLLLPKQTDVRAGGAQQTHFL